VSGPARHTTMDRRREVISILKYPKSWPVGLKLQDGKTTWAEVIRIMGIDESGVIHGAFSAPGIIPLFKLIINQYAENE
jgi:hypothetical protein